MEVLYCFPIEFKCLNQMNLLCTMSLTVTKQDAFRNNVFLCVRDFFYLPIWNATIMSQHSLNYLFFIFWFFFCDEVQNAKCYFTNFYDDIGLQSAA